MYDYTIRVVSTDDEVMVEAEFTSEQNITEATAEVLDTARRAHPGKEFLVIRAENGHEGIGDEATISQEEWGVRIDQAIQNVRMEKKQAWLASKQKVAAARNTPEGHARNLKELVRLEKVFSDFPTREAFVEDFLDRADGHIEDPMIANFLYDDYQYRLGSLRGEVQRYREGIRWFVDDDGKTVWTKDGQIIPEPESAREGREVYQEHKKRKYTL